MAAWTDILGKGGTVAEQLLVWGLLNQLLGALLGPTMDLVGQDVNAAHPVAVLAPAELASALVRNFMDRPAAEAEAAKNGIDAERLAVLKALAGEAPAPFQLAEALRRRIIEAEGKGAAATSFEQGIAEGRLGDKWGPVIEALAVQWPTPNDALEALLEGQIDRAAAEDLYRRFGGDPQYFQMLFDTRGNAPTPMEAIEMLRRGIIPDRGTGPASVSYEQAFLEGPWRNKWLGPFEALKVAVPPPRTVTTLLSHGVITHDQAVKWFTDSGLDPAAAQAYAASAVAERVAVHRELTVAQVLELYYDHLATHDQATAMLANLGYEAATADYLLQLQDFSRNKAAYNAAVSRIGALYVNHKLPRADAVAGLGRLDVPAEAVTQLMGTWDTEVATNVVNLTAAQVEGAFAYGIKDQAWCVAALMRLGYTAHDAWIALSVRAHGPLPDEPAATAGSGVASPEV